MEYMQANNDTSVGSLWHARYRESAADSGHVASNEVVRNLLNHRSVRAYLPGAVPESMLAAAIAAAQSASTSSNLQAWSVIAITDPARKARLAALAGNQLHIETAPLYLAWVLDLSRLRRAGESQRRPTDGLDYLETFVVGAVDTALAAQNAAAAFESFGLGLVYIGGMRNHPEAVARELALPAQSVVLFGMCVGFPDPDHLPAVKPRLPQTAVLHREQYNASAEHESIDAYDERVSEYLQERGGNAGSWREAAVARIGSAGALSGRDRLREALSALAFKLL
ncbi:Oxygen-insensitive NADPH nitroreductase [Burkholderia singularis]|uniref:Oxygen-insensitive NADPH nitroreductase n=2 Tax=Burkholderia singularis TaxID=1503053 RepID=A0A238GZE9_9BURK|nr:Oxygen-insensitive NADPH nitroreductase [Burkholderia singularis]